MRPFAQSMQTWHMMARKRRKQTQGKTGTTWKKRERMWRRMLTWVMPRCVQISGSKSRMNVGENTVMVSGRRQHR